MRTRLSLLCVLSVFGIFAIHSDAQAFDRLLCVKVERTKVKKLNYQSYLKPIVAGTPMSIAFLGNDGTAAVEVRRATRQRASTQIVVRAGQDLSPAKYTDTIKNWRDQKKAMESILDLPAGETYEASSSPMASLNFMDGANLVQVQCILCTHSKSCPSREGLAKAGKDYAHFEHRELEPDQMGRR